MARKAVRDLINEAMSEHKIANVYMKYNENYFNLIPINTSERLFLAINEDDFILDGFRVSRFRDVDAVRIKDDKCDEIVRYEGLLDNLDYPDLNLESWQTVFHGLGEMGNNFIVEYETAEGTEDNFTIGKIQRVYKSCLYMYSFDADGIWDAQPYRIPYHEVTSVTINSRYVNVFSKYIPPAPAR